MRWPRKGILIRIAIYGTLITVLAGARGNAGASNLRPANPPLPKVATSLAKNARLPCPTDANKKSMNSRRTKPSSCWGIRCRSGTRRPAVGPEVQRLTKPLPRIDPLGDVRQASESNGPQDLCRTLRRNP